MKTCLLVALALPLMAAAPQRQLTLVLPTETLNQPFSATTPTGSRFQPAPLPNREMSGPTGPRESSDPTLAPTVFSSREQYRGDGFSRGNTPQNEQERNARPRVGFSLHMPFTPQ